MSKMKKEISQMDRGLAAISYIWVLWLIAMVLGGQNEFILRHAKQGLILFIAEILIMALAIIPILGWLIGFIGFIASLVFTVLGFMHAWKGEEWELPVIGAFANRLNF